MRELQVRLVAIDTLIPDPKNSRTHTELQIAQVAASILAFGWTNPILVRPSMVIIAGHARLLAARKLGLTEVPIIELAGLSEAQCRALVIADNQLAIAGAGWNQEMLALEIAALREAEFPIDLLGFEDADLARYAGGLTAGLTDEDDAPELPVTPASAAGDVWILGTHRVLVGDATDKAAVELLMAGSTAALVFTDPPYNVDYEGYTGDKLKIEGDKMTPVAFKLFLQATFRAYRGVVAKEGSLYVCHPSSFQREFQDALEAAGFAVRCQIIWAKNTFAWGFGRYKFQHEPMFYAHVDGGIDPWYGDKTQSTLWEEKKPAANRLHPTMKPVELVERALVNSSKTGDIVADLFGGSGSTLIACERRGRAARLMELDPKYADVIVKRWQEFAGKVATLEADGRTFAEVSAERLGPKEEKAEAPAPAPKKKRPATR